MLIATGCDDGKAKIWSFDDMRQENKVECLATLKGHISGITSISWSPSSVGRDGLLLTSSKDRLMKVWRPFDHSVAKSRVVPHETLPRQSRRTEGSIDAAEGSEKRPDSGGHEDYVNMAQWRHTGKEAGQHILSCSDDTTAAIWSVADGKRLFKLNAEGVGHREEVSMATWSPDCTRILTCSYDKFCILWSPRNGHHMKTFPSTWKKDPVHCHQEPIWTARFSPEGHEFLTASKDGTARLWDVTTGNGQILHDDKVQEIHGAPRSHMDVVFDACWNKGDPNQIVTCSLDMTAKIWDKRSGKVSQMLPHHNACVWSAVFGNDVGSQGRMVLTCSHDMTALVYDQRLGMPKNMLSGHTGILWQASFSADDYWVVTCSEDRTARLWNLSTGARRPPSHILMDPESPHEQAVTCAAFMEREADL